MKFFGFVCSFSVIVFAVPDISDEAVSEITRIYFDIKNKTNIVMVYS